MPHFMPEIYVCDTRDFFLFKKVELFSAITLIGYFYLFRWYCLVSRNISMRSDFGFQADLF